MDIPCRLQRERADVENLDLRNATLAFNQKRADQNRAPCMLHDCHTHLMDIIIEGRSQAACLRL
jgi:hypothetical protein